jgi:5-methylthioribose kinase
MEEKLSDSLKRAHQFLRANNLDSLSCSPLERGISNDNFLLGGKYVLKVPYDKRFITLSEDKIALQEEAAKRFLSPNVICYDLNEGFLVTEYLLGFHSLNVYKIDALQTVNIIKAIKAFHQLPRGVLKELNYEQMLDKYRLLCPPKDRIYLRNIEYSPLLKENCQVAHFDLVDNNILLNSSSDCRLIDYEFCCYAPKYFDLVSLISENPFKLSSSISLIDEYFKDDEESKQEFFLSRSALTALADLLWYHWAKARAQTDDEEKKKAYLQIASEKKISLIVNIRKNPAK